jgi:hypothetical protein
MFVSVNCAKLIGEWADREDRQHPILYVFEKGPKDYNYLQRLFYGVRPEMKRFYRMTEPDSFAIRDRRNTPQLQAADVLAIEVRKEMERRLQEPDNRRKMRESIKNLHIPMLDHWSFIGKSELLKVFEHELMIEAISTEGYKAEVATTKWKPTKL